MNLRNQYNIKTPICKTKIYKSSFFPMSIQLWNELPNEKKGKPTLAIFKSNLKKKDKPRKIFLLW